MCLKTFMGLKEGYEVMGLKRGYEVIGLWGYVFYDVYGFMKRVYRFMKEVMRL